MTATTTTTTIIVIVITTHNKTSIDVSFLYLSICTHIQNESELPNLFYLSSETDRRKEEEKKTNKKKDDTYIYINR